MRILVIHCAYQLKGGEDVVVGQEVDLLQSKGNIVELLLFSNATNALSSLLQLPFNLHSYLETKRKIRSFEPDVIHIHNLHFGGTTSVLRAINKNIPIIHTLHNYRILCPSGTLFNKGSLYLKSLKSIFPWNAAYKGVYKHSVPLTFWLAITIWLNHVTGIWKSVSGFIVLSAHSKKIFEQSSLDIDTGKMFIKPNFIDDDHLANKKRDNNFLFVGRLSEEKGIKILLDAFAGTEHLVTIIGDGPCRQEVEEYVKLNPNITYLGFQNKETITAQMQKCTALIFPSAWYETFGLTIIEAFAASTPIVAANIGSASVLINHHYNGLHFNSGDIQSLKDSLLTWQNLPDARKEAYCNNAHRTYERYYTPEKNYEQLLSIYTDAINDKRLAIASVYFPIQLR